MSPPLGALDRIVKFNATGTADYGSTAINADSTLEQATAQPQRILSDAEIKDAKYVKRALTYEKNIQLGIPFLGAASIAGLVPFLIWFVKDINTRSFNDKLERDFLASLPQSVWDTCFSDKSSFSETAQITHRLDTECLDESISDLGYEDFYDSSRFGAHYVYLDGNPDVNCTSAIAPYCTPFKTTQSQRRSGGTNSDLALDGALTLISLMALMITLSLIARAFHSAYRYASPELKEVTKRVVANNGVEIPGWEKLSARTLYNKLSPLWAALPTTTQPAATAAPTDATPLVPGRSSSV